MYGDPESARGYFDTLAGLIAREDPPLQVAYAIDGGKRPKERERRDSPGYRHSDPVRFGNHAYAQKQLGMYGFLADCSLTYLRHGGRWDSGLFDVVARCADYVADHWDEPDSGIWELRPECNHVAAA